MPYTEIDKQTPPEEQTRTRPTPTRPDRFDDGPSDGPDTPPSNVSQKLGYLEASIDDLEVEFKRLAGLVKPALAPKESMEVDNPSGDYDPEKSGQSELAARLMVSVDQIHNLTARVRSISARIEL